MPAGAIIAFALRLLRAAFPILAGLLLLGLLAGTYSVLIEPRWLEVERVEVRLAHLPSSFNGYQIVQLSDLHLSRYNPPEKIRAAVDLAMRLQPDLIVLTGDFVSSLREGEAESLERELARLRARDGVYAVLGNHDWWTDQAAVSDALARARVRLLRNSYARLRRGEEYLYLAGVDDTWENKDDLDSALLGIPEGAPMILLVHEPDFAIQAGRDGRVGLQLSGHTHGGQVRLPGLEPFHTPRYGHLYVNGLYTLAGMQIYVSRGVGVIFPPVRFFCRPEVTLITLEPDGGKED